MPKVKRKKSSGTPGDWHIHVKNNSAPPPPVYTLQVHPAGRDIILSANLEHDNTPKRTAYIDWDLFRTLDDLDLLYTKGEASDSTGSNLQPGDDWSMNGLSPDQRLAFVKGLVKNRSVERLMTSKQVLEVIQSLDPGIAGYDSLLAVVLEGTPFEPMTVRSPDTWVDRFGPARSLHVSTYDTALLALVTKLFFDALVSNAGALFDSVVQSGECRELWLCDGWCAFGGGELILHPVSEHQDLSVVDWEPLRADSVNITNPSTMRFLHTIYPSLSKGQLQTELRPFETGVKDEVDTAWLLLVPKPPDRSDSDLQTSFNEV